MRLYVDDVPATQPDGQGSTSNFNLASAARVEVLRGPFSALYGNSAGGVVEIFTADGASPAGRLTLFLDGNYYGTTTSGGTYGYGTVYKISSTGKFTTVYTMSHNLLQRIQTKINPQYRQLRQILTTYDRSQCGFHPHRYLLGRA